MLDGYLCLHKIQKAEILDYRFNLVQTCIHFHLYQLLTLINNNNLFLLSSSHSNVTDSITLSGDERELGKVCVQVSYQEALEQVWITVVQVRLHAVRRGHKELHCALLQQFSMDPLCVQNTGLC